MTAPLDGRMTSFSSVPATLAGDELMWIVQPGNVANGVLYNSTLSTLAAFFSTFPFLNTVVITSGATLASPYDILTTDTRILLNKTVASASYLVVPLASTLVYGQPVVIKDLKGDADSNPITISFTGGELCDGSSTISIDNAYGWLTIAPIPGGGAWYQT